MSAARKAILQQRLFNARQSLAANFKDAKTYSGDMTYHARKRLSKAISLLNQSSPWQDIITPYSDVPMRFKLSFITLTIPDDTPISGKEAYEALLKPFLRRMRTKFGLQKYVWKAELQERGQLHYHITSNCFIPYMAVQEAWNNILTAANLNSAYFAAHGHRNAPSTEIRRVKNVKNIEAYLLKYISKSDGLGRSVNGKTWGCSENLKSFGYYTEIFNEYNQMAIEKCVEAGKAVMKQLEHCVIVSFPMASPGLIMSRVQRAGWLEHIRMINNYSPGLSNI